jgi:hypothetical protein
VTTRQNEVRRILTKLYGTEPDDATVATMANVAEAADIGPNDALFPVMIALDYYRTLYERVPGQIKAETERTLDLVTRETANALRKMQDTTIKTLKVHAEGTEERVTEEVRRSYSLITDHASKSKDELVRKAAAEINAAVKADLKDRLAELDNAAARLNQSVREAQERTNQIHKTDTWGNVLYAVLGGVVAGFIVAAGVAYLVTTGKMRPQVSFSASEVGEYILQGIKRK